MSADRTKPRRALSALIVLALVAGGAARRSALIAAAAKGDTPAVRELLGRGAAGLRAARTA